MTSETISLKATISPRTEKWIRVSAVLAMIIVAVSSAILSFDGLKKVALDSQVPENLAFLFPIAVDTTILMGSLAVLLYELFGVRAVFGWVTVLFGTLLSIIGNVISVKDAGLIAQVLHGIIPVLLCISLESLLRILRFNIKRTRVAHAVIPPLEPAHEGTQLSSEIVQEEKPAPSTPAPIKETVAPREKEVGYRESNDITKETPLPVAPKPKPAPEPVQAPVKTVATPEPVEVKEAVEPQPKAPVQPVATPVAAQNSVKVEQAPAPAEKASVPLEETPQEEPKPEPKTQPATSSVQDEGNVIERYRTIINPLDENLSKAAKVAEILKEYPSATGAEIKATFGDPPELRIDGTMRRAKALLQKA